MRLGTKLTIAFGAVTLLSLAPLTIIAREVIGNRYRQELHRSLDEAAAQTDRAYEAAIRDLDRTATRLVRPDDPFAGLVARALIVAGDQPVLLSDEAAREATARDLDVLVLVDQAGRVLAAPADPAREGQTEPATLARLRAPSQRARIVEERPRFVHQGPGRLALEVVREMAPVNGHRGPWLIAGVWLDDILPEHLGPSMVRLVRPSTAAPAGTEVRKVELDVDADSPAMVVEIRATDATLHAALDDLNVAAAILALGGVVLAMFAGAAVAGRITKPLDELAEGADALARGRRDLALPVRGRDEVATVTKRFNEMVSALSAAEESALRAERVAAWREMAQHLAHELKNPLTPIQMSIETLQRARARPDRAADFDRLFTESAQVILDEVTRLKSIVSEFSRFARLPAPSFQSVDVVDLCEAAAKLYDNTIPLTRELVAEPVLARADRDQLQQVLVNLLENAREAVADVAAPRVVMRAQRRGARVIIEILDNGLGIDPAIRDRLFQPYATSKAGGTGLGLALVHRIVTEHGGTVTAVEGLANERGVGAGFVVEIDVA